MFMLCWSNPALPPRKTSSSTLLPQTSHLQDLNRLPSELGEWVEHRAWLSEENLVEHSAVMHLIVGKITVVEGINIILTEIAAAVLAPP